jgi:hypothetical protein
VTDCEQLPLAAKDHLLVRDEPGETDRVDGRVTADEIGGCACSARRRVLLRLTVQLDDLRARKVLRSLFREAHHQHRAEREVRRNEHT